MRELNANADTLYAAVGKPIVDDRRSGDRLSVPVHERIVGRSLGLAAYREDAAGNVFFEPPSYCDDSKSYFVEGGKGGTARMVCLDWLNDFPVATHWDASLNGGGGGMRAGGVDGLGRLIWDAEAGAAQSRLDLADSDPDSPYLYASDRSGLVAEDWAHPGGEALRAPSLDRYIGAGYSLFGVEEEIALRLSDDMLEAFGYPVVFRNAAPEGPGPLRHVEAFQIVSGHRLGRFGDPPHLASFILPPGWPGETEAAYPAVFSGYYDLNESTFAACGPPLLRMIGRTLTETGKSAVGILWNGGGAIGTRTQHASAFAQMNALFGAASDAYRVDADRIVAVGGSRGGLTALLAASNPEARGYRIRYAVCYGPPLSLYGRAERLLDATYPARWQAICGDTGFKHAWFPGWRDAAGRTAVELYRANTFGTSDEAEIGERFAPTSARLLSALRAMGTQIWLNTPTHDPFTASSSALTWAAAARAAGIPLQHELGYRYGHNNCTDPYENALICLKALALGEPLALDGVSQYRRAAANGADWRKAERFLPAEPPFYFEGPKRAVAGMTTTLGIYGVPGRRYRLAVRSVGGSDGERSGDIGGGKDVKDGFDEKDSYDMKSWSGKTDEGENRKAYKSENGNADNGEVGNASKSENWNADNGEVGNASKSENWNADNGEVGNADNDEFGNAYKSKNWNANNGETWNKAGDDALGETDSSGAGEHVLAEGALPAAALRGGNSAAELASRIAFTEIAWQVPESWGGMAFVYDLRVEDAEGRWRRVPGGGVWPGGDAGALPAHDRPAGEAAQAPDLIVLRETPDFTSGAWLSATMKDFVGWGLSDA
ncbi:hypothetical protein [Cohnella sp. GCM10012308]|uniref:hypothetical protein n=1 Tax=Cohnella sp. GCM10012308 TaxID=3317329 RepID=UPI00361954C8